MKGSTGTRKDTTSSSRSGASSGDDDYDNDDDVFLEQYAPLRLADIEKEAKVCEQLATKVVKEWEEESAKYEEIVDVHLADKPSVRHRPRRNYANPGGSVEDASLFPYHSSCYPLLQAYDGLYYVLRDDNDEQENGSEDWYEEAQPIESNAILPGSFPRNVYYGPTHWTATHSLFRYGHDGSIPGYMPASRTVIASVFWNKTPGPFCSSFDGRALFHETMVQLLESYSTRAVISNSTIFLSEAQQVPPFGLWDTYTGNNLLTSAQWQSVNAEDCSPAAFPTDSACRRHVLLRLLKHAMSELSRDHGLAAVILARMMEERDFDDLDCMHETLMILASEEPVACGMPCDDDHDDDDDEDNLPDHECQDYDLAGRALTLLVAHGMTYLSRGHATALVGFARYCVMREFGHLFRNVHSEQDVDDDDDDVQVATRVRKTAASDVEKNLNIHMKRSIIANRSDEDDVLPTTDAGDSGNAVPIALLSRIIWGLGLKGSIERARLEALLESLPSSSTGNQGRQQRHEELIAKSLDSYHNCLRAQVAIAETVSVILPSMERFYHLSSAIVFSITGTLVLEPSAFINEGDEAYLGQRLNDAEYEKLRVSAPFRLAENIRNATALTRDRLKHQPPLTTTDDATRFEQLQQAAHMVCEGRPHDDIRNAVRMLFLRDLVDVRVSRLGYADFLLWCRFEVDAFDPVLFWKEFNLPCEEEEDESDDEEEDEEEDAWAFDEDGQRLHRGELEARFDFSLFALVCEWNKPWTPESHMSFHPEFRRAVQTLALCMHRLHLPKELVGGIAQFLPRNGWWPEERRKCWNYHCLAEHDVEDLLLRHGFAGNAPQTTAKTEPSIACEKCRVAVYCSRSCREQDYKETHKRLCGRPPFCLPGIQEIRFCEMIESGSPLDDSGNGTVAAPDDLCNEDVNDDDDGDEDDGSWESIDSDDDTEENDDEAPTNQLTRQILQFFHRYNDDS